MKELSILRIKRKPYKDLHASNSCGGGGSCQNCGGGHCGKCGGGKCSGTPDSQK